MVKEKTAQVMSQINISPEVKAAWQEFQQKMINNSNDGQLMAAYEKLSDNDQIQYGAMLIQIYGDKLGKFILNRNVQQKRSLF